MPRDYKRMLDAIRRVEASGLSGEEALQAAFEENARDVSRVGGGLSSSRTTVRPLASRRTHGETHGIY